ncbi:hypothetical protein MKW92_039287 [Papaver armeniacum]|nr:hypothetical protein MKW92_039287 [Papaver armeniacum]
MAKVYHLVLGIQGLITILIATFIVLIVYITGKSAWLVFEDILTTSTTTLKGYSESVSLTSSCDLFSGKWVYDNSTYPLYSEKQCSFMSDQLACEKFGRKDLNYQNWRWQPDQCDLPRFNATSLLERLRGKRMVYVGDSLNRNQWVSMVCLVESVIPSAFKSINTNGSLITFKAIVSSLILPRLQEVNMNIMQPLSFIGHHYWLNRIGRSVNHRLPDRIVRAQAIEKHAIHWTDADILVFNSYLWWRRPRMKIEMLRSYELALKTWSDWLEIHVNHTKTELADEWSTAKEGNCYNETEPISQKHYRGRGSDPKMMNVVEKMLDELKTRGVNKRRSSSMYRKQWDPLTPEQISNPASYSDCIHWCLLEFPILGTSSFMLTFFPNEEFCEKCLKLRLIPNDKLK